MKNRKESWIKGLLVIGLSIGTLIVSLFLSATAYSGLNRKALLLSYFSKPEILLLNWIPIILLYCLFFSITGRNWIGFTISYALSIGISLVNYYKISLRADPLLAEDIAMAVEAGNIMKNYSIEFDLAAGIAIAYLLLGLLIERWASKKVKRKKKHLLVAVVCAALGVALQSTVYMNDKIYAQVVNKKYINEWNPVETYLSKGCIYSFLNSVKDVYHQPPEGYHEETVKSIYASYQDESIPDEKKVSVMTIMLEAFCDLTDYPEFANRSSVVDVYKSWHELEEMSVSGNLITDIFAGNTVQTERAFITGDNMLVNYRRDAESYARYFKSQGYSTYGYHLYYDWFYNRRNVNLYLGFDEYGYFYDIWSAQEKEPWMAFRDSDKTLTEKILQKADEKLKEGPLFTFSVSVQNHGPYEATYDLKKSYLMPEETGWSKETCHIFNNYLSGVEDTLIVMKDLTETLNQKNEPIVLVLFGDHKPWGGNGNSAYQDAGIDFDISTLEGMYNYFSTPYLIWANDAAKSVLDNDFVGTGRDISPCFLMAELFDQCGWEGPAFMQMSREIREITPLLHSYGLFMVDGELRTELPEEHFDAYNRYMQVQFYRRNKRIDQ